MQDTVYRIYVEKKAPFAQEAAKLLADATGLLGIGGLEAVRVVNRYDAQAIDEALFAHAVDTVFSEPQVDTATAELDMAGADHVFATEYLPGQFDQRADSAAQCIQLISRGDRPIIRSAKVYLLYGSLTADEVAEIKKYVINPVEAREASLEKPASLRMAYAVPGAVERLDGFGTLSREGLADFIRSHGLAMDLDDIAFCQQYFNSEHREPTITEIRIIDTYWSDHCRHTTFLTEIDEATFEDPLLEKAYQHYLKVRHDLGRTKPVCLMDLATIAVKQLRRDGRLDKLDESEEINACTVKITVTADGVEEPWLLLFKNETHNHPTEIEPFGGAATCIGGAIRDPLSGRSYVYGAMRVTGAADPTVPVQDTIPGKLPQRKLVTTAAAGYSSYGNQIGLATGIVDEVYHPGYAAKRMEIGAVIAATPQDHVRRETPAPGDVVILLGGSTGRDGIGGATGSSKAHDSHSVETCGAEVQKGNAPEERKLQRLFRNGTACRMIKRCNDFGAGGVSVAIGELADGLAINLDAVPKKYEGLDGTELAISESQERMAVVVAPEDAEAFIALAGQENLQAVVVATVTESPRMVMHWNGQCVADLSREFLNTNGASKHIKIHAVAPALHEEPVAGTFRGNLLAMAGSLNCCSKRGLSERFDSTIGAGTVLMPFGGRYQRTPIQAMVQKISMEEKHTDDCSLMAFGYNPFLAEQSPYHGAYLAVVESVAKLIATGASFEDVYLTFQEYFEKPGTDPERWGKPLSALLGAFEAQMDYGIGAIGGKDSMSGSFEKLDVPPTLVSFAVTTGKVADVISPEFKRAGSRVVLLTPERNADGLPVPDCEKAIFAAVTAMARAGRALAMYTPGIGGVAEAVMKMAIGNGFGFRFAEGISSDTLFHPCYGAFVVELDGDAELPAGIPCTLLGTVTADGLYTYGTEAVRVDDVNAVYEGKLEGVYPNSVHGGVKTGKAPGDMAGAGACTGEAGGKQPMAEAPAVKRACPRALIPVFPGTNCEFDTARALRAAGAEADILVINNLSADGVARSVERFAEAIRTAQMICIPGGFSGGDEPDGSGKFITAFFRNAQVAEEVTRLLGDRDGLMCGICNGFQALIKLGLVPYGKIMDTDAGCPTLTYNSIGRHQSRIVRTRIASTKSPWLSLMHEGDIVNVPISHGEGRFIAEEKLIGKLFQNGQVATQYVDLAGRPTDDIQFNPNNSMYAIEGITSPDGRVFGKMGHSERIDSGLYKNVPGNYDIRMFEAAVRYLTRG